MFLFRGKFFRREVVHMLQCIANILSIVGISVQLVWIAMQMADRSRCKKK